MKDILDLKQKAYFNNQRAEAYFIEFEVYKALVEKLLKEYVPLVKVGIGVEALPAEEKKCEIGDVKIDGIRLIEEKARTAGTLITILSNIPKILEINSNNCQNNNVTIKIKQGETEDIASKQHPITSAQTLINFNSDMQIAGSKFNLNKEYTLIISGQDFSFFYYFKIESNSAPATIA